MWRQSLVLTNTYVHLHRCIRSRIHMCALISTAALIIALHQMASNSGFIMLPCLYLLVWPDMTSRQLSDLSLYDNENAIAPFLTAEKRRRYCDFCHS